MIVAEELADNRMASGAREPLLAVGEATGRVERTEELTAEVILVQLRSVVVDLLLLTGLTSSSRPTRCRRRRGERRE